MSIPVLKYAVTQEVYFRKSFYKMNDPSAFLKASLVLRKYDQCAHGQKRGCEAFISTQKAKQAPK